jgi:membrane-associated phospholipid phosphatase
MNETLFDQIDAVARATPWLHGLITTYATYGVVVVVVFAVLLGAGWWSARRGGEPQRMAAAVCAGAATLLAVAINQPIVNAVHEARPYTDHPGVLVLATRSADFSFPSDHAVMAGAVAVGLLFVSRRLAVLAGIAGVAMAFARVYVAAHYPADVAVGLVLGATMARVVYLAARRLIASAVTALVNSDSRLRPLVTTSAPRPVAMKSSR